MLERIKMYLQDVHVENFASRRPSTAMLFIRVLLIVLGVICVIPFGLYLWPLIIALGLFILAWFVGTRTQIDFDYSYTNGTIEIDRVFTKSSRKKYLTFSMSDVITVARLDSDYLRAYQGRGMKVYDCTSQNGKDNVYAVVFRFNKQNEEIVLMELEDDFLDAMEQAARDTVHR